MKNNPNIEDFLKINEKIVDSGKLGKILNVAPRTIRFWVETQGAPKLDRGKYPLYRFLQWRFQKLEHDLEIAKSKIDDRLIHLKIQTQKIILAERTQKYKQFLESVIPVSLVKEHWGREQKYLRKRSKELAKKLFNSLQNVNDKTERMILINDEVNKMLLEISNDRSLD